MSSQSQPATLPLSDTKTDQKGAVLSDAKTDQKGVVNQKQQQQQPRRSIKAETRDIDEAAQLRLKLASLERKVAILSKYVKTAHAATAELAKAVLDIENGTIEPWDPHAIDDAIECAKTVKRTLKKAGYWNSDDDEE